MATINVSIQKLFIKEINSIAAAAFFVFFGFILFLGFISYRIHPRIHHRHHWQPD